MIIIDSYILIIFIIFFSVIFILLFSNMFFGLNYDFFFTDFDNYKNKWKKLLIDNYNLIKTDCLHVKIKSYKSLKKRNKLWNDIKNDKHIKNKWILGSESINSSWLNYALILNYKFIYPNCYNCLNVYNVLKGIISSGINIKVAGFSWLKPNSYIPYHVDNNNGKVYHFGILCPHKKSYIHVKHNNKNKYIYHKNRSIITFNDNYLHSAVNKSNQDRIILYLLID